MIRHLPIDARFLATPRATVVGADFNNPKVWNWYGLAAAQQGKSVDDTRAMDRWWSSLKPDQRVGTRAAHKAVLEHVPHLSPADQIRWWTGLNRNVRIALRNEYSSNQGLLDDVASVVTKTATRVSSIAARTASGDIQGALRQAGRLATEDVGPIFTSAPMRVLFPGIAAATQYAIDNPEQVAAIVPGGGAVAAKARQLAAQAAIAAKNGDMAALDAIMDQAAELEPALGTVADAARGASSLVARARARDKGAIKSLGTVARGAKSGDPNAKRIAALVRTILKAERSR